MTTQDDFMADAKVDCICTEDNCADEFCDACNGIDSEWPCPATQEWSDLMGDRQ